MNSNTSLFSRLIFVIDYYIDDDSAKRYIPVMMTVGPVVVGGSVSLLRTQPANSRMLHASKKLEVRI